MVAVWRGHNHRRISRALGDAPPTEYEADYHASTNAGRITRGETEARGALDDRYHMP